MTDPWAAFEKLGVTRPVRAPHYDVDSKVMTMGSCFALEVRRALLNKGNTVFPQYHGTYHKDREWVWYTAASIAQEVQLAFGEIARSPNSLWEVQKSKRGTTYRWQDVRRKMIFGPTRDALWASVTKTDAIMSGWFREATDFIFTLGHIEAWKTRDTWACLPNRGRCRRPEDAPKLHILSFEDCKAAIRTIATTVRKHRPDASITFSVSPVPLARTYRIPPSSAKWPAPNVVQANKESKETQRRALREVMEELDYIYYFPSYEMVIKQGKGAFISKGKLADGRYVRPDVVERIMSAFLSVATDE